MRVHIAILSFVLLVLPRVALAAPLKDEAFEQSAVAEIEAKDADAARLYREANAMRHTDAQKASDLYAQVLAKVPDFDHALRRRCGAELMLHHDAEGLSLCRRALAVRRTAPNLIGVAGALIERDPKQVTQSEKAEALSLSDEAARISDDAMTQMYHAQIALQAEDMERFRAAVKRLESRAPDADETHYFAGLLACFEGRFDDADHHIDRAKALGASPQLVAALVETRKRAQAEMQPWRAPAVWLLRITAAWAIGLALLALMGFLTSRATLNALRDKPEEAVSEREAGLRRLYRAIVWIAAAYYYVSLPLVALAVLGTFGAAVVICLMAGYIPIKLLLIAAVVTFATLWATLKSLFVRIPERVHGTAIGPKDHRRFHSLVETVAAKIGTRPPDEVRLTAGTDLAVMERAGSFREASGRGKRTMYLGIALLDGMRVRELKALVAHEMGHFKNEDTAGGGLALSVRRTIVLMAVGIAQAGAAVPWNPAWWFLRMYHALFLRISQGASRLQEVLADRWSIMAYGSEAFARGLEHVITCEHRFDTHVDRTVREVDQTKVGLGNLYAFRPSKPVTEEEVSEKARESIEAQPSVYDSHPSPAERLATARSLALDGEPLAPGDEDEAWSLFDDREALEREMTEDIRAALVDKGFVLPRAAEG